MVIKLVTLQHCLVERQPSPCWRRSSTRWWTSPWQLKSEVKIMFTGHWSVSKKNDLLSSWLLQFFHLMIRRSPQKRCYEQAEVKVPGHEGCKLVWKQDFNASTEYLNKINSFIDNEEIHCGTGDVKSCKNELISYLNILNRLLVIIYIITFTIFTRPTV